MIALATLLAANLLGAGSLTGKVTLTGLAPKLAYYALQDLRGRGPREPSTWEWLRRAFGCILRDGPRPPAEGSHDC